MVLQQIDRNVNLTSQVLVDTALASKSERMEHDGATYSARTVESKGRTYTKLTINDTKTMRKHRYFISFIKAIGRAVKRLFQRKSIRPYLDGRTAHLRSQLTDTDRKALKAVKVCGTLPDEKLGESENYGIHTASIGITDRIHMASMVNSILKDFGVQSEVAPNDTPLEEPGIGEFDSWPAQAEGASKGTASLDNGIDLEAGSLDGDVDLSDWGVVGEQETIVDYPVENLVPENGFYEVQLATCIQGIIKEPHVVSLVIDPHHKQFYLMDTKGTNPENLHFYYGSQGNRRVSELTVDDLVGALKEKEQFRGYSLTVTPSFQKVGDCVASAEAMTRSLAAVRHNLVKAKMLDKVGPNYEIMAALATVYENYDELVTEGVRAKLET